MKMMCSPKTLIKILLGIGALLLVGYTVFPMSHPWIGAAAPYLLVLACPLAMYFALKGMNTQAQEKEKGQHGK
jgi:hypothetical protein